MRRPRGVDEILRERAVPVSSPPVVTAPRTRRGLPLAMSLADAVAIAGSLGQPSKMPVAGKGSIECRAVEQRDNKCGPCRACWDARVRNVSYPQH